DEVEHAISTIVVGYQKLLNDLRKRGLFKITEGKQALMNAGYVMLAKLLLRFDPRTRKVGAQASTASFAWTFFHIGWQDNSLVIQEQGHKGDQTGSDKFWNHIFANPLQPKVCPVLALAVLVFAGPPRAATGRQQLFMVLYSLTEQDKQTLGQEREDLGPYSLRKGSASYCLGQVNAANPVTVQLRMGHGLGKWREIVDGYDNYPDGFKTCFPYLLASLIYHELYLREFLYDAHPLWNSRVFANNSHLHALRADGAILLGVDICPDTWLRATGIPTHLAIADKITKLIEESQAMQRDTLAMWGEIFDRLPNEVALAVGGHLRTHFQVTGIAPVSLHDIDRSFGEMTATM
ncbi:hypothetical protein B484DRAFT_307516, partial [Ochromonadaceae sp. CCMP2298]